MLEGLDICSSVCCMLVEFIDLFWIVGTDGEESQKEDPSFW